MSRRKSKARDSRKFRKTAARSKTINLNPKVYRGGIRL